MSDSFDQLDGWTGIDQWCPDNPTMQRFHRNFVARYGEDPWMWPNAIPGLAKTTYDALVVEPTATVKGSESFDMHAMVDQLHAARPGRLVIAYLDAAQAENFRTYWGPSWKAPTKKSSAKPKKKPAKKITKK